MLGGNNRTASLGQMHFCRPPKAGWCATRNKRHTSHRQAGASDQNLRREISGAPGAALDVYRPTLSRVGSFHECLAERRMRVHVTCNLVRRQFHHVRQGQLR